jgi:CRP-like cAMP-binding protein
MPYDLLFSSIEKFVSLDDDNKQTLRELFVLRKVKKGQFLVHKGAVERNQVFIVKGSAITYFTDFNGSEHVIQFGIEGWWVSDLQSYLFQKPAICNVEALEDSEVLEASYDKIQLLYKSVPAFERYHRIITQHGYAAFQQRMLENLSMDAEERYLTFAKKYGGLELRFPQKIIASYLGMSPEFFSKLKKRVGSKGNS